MARIVAIMPLQLQVLFSAHAHHSRRFHVSVGKSWYRSDVMHWWVPEFESDNQNPWCVACGIFVPEI
jgi:hypothetical protein